MDLHDFPFSYTAHWPKKLNRPELEQMRQYVHVWYKVICLEYTHDWLGFYAEIQIIFWDSADCEQLHNVPYQGDWCYQSYSIGRRVLKMLGQLGGGVKGTESRDFLPPLPQFWMLLNLPVWAPDWRVKVQYFRVWLRFHGDIRTDFFKLRGVIDTIETHSSVSMTPRSVLHMWISPWNRNYSTV